MKYTVCHVDEEEFAIVVDHVEADTPDDAIDACITMRHEVAICDPVVFEGHLESLT